VPITGLKGSPLDVISAYDRMVAAVPAAGDDPACLRPDGSPLTHAEFVDFTKRLVQSLGFNPLAVAGHSYRRGGASFAAYCKVPEAFIKLIGDWRSNAYLAYILIPASSRVCVSAAMCTKIRDGDFGDQIFGG
jgi:hypothetical protein